MDRKKQHSFAASAFFLLGIITLNRIFGMLRSLLLANLFGVSQNAAAFELAQNLTATLYDCTLGALLSTMFLPSYVRRAQNENREQADRFAATFSLLLPLGTLFLFLPYIFFPNQTVSLLAPNLSKEASLTAAASLPLLSFGKILLAVASLFTGILQADKKPLLPAFVYAAASFVSIPLVYVFRRSLTAVTLSCLLLAIDFGILFTLLFPILKQHRPQGLITITPTNPAKTLRRAASVLLYSAYLPIIISLTSLFFARFGEDSALAVGGYALRPVLLASALLFSAFHGVYYPSLSENRQNTRTKIQKPLLLFVILSLLAAAFFLLFAKSILSLFLKNASVSADFMQSAIRIMRLYAASLPFLTLAAIGNDAAYLTEKSGKVATVGILSLLVAIFSFFVLKEPFGILSVPIAFFIASAVRAFFTLHILLKMRQTPKKIKLLLVLSDCNIGGAGRQMLNYLSHCNRNRFDVTVALPEHSLLAQKVESLGFPILSCGKETSFSLFSVFSYYRLIQKQKPHILHANASLSARIAAFLAGVPIRLYTRHCVYPTPPLFQKKIPRLAMRFATDLLSTSVIAVAEEAANNLYSMGVSPKKVTVIVNGVDPIPKDFAKRQTIRNRYHVKAHETLAVICGRIEPDKGIRTLIEAVSLLFCQNHPIKLLIVGTGSEEQALRRLTQTYALTEQVHFCGFVEDVSPYLSAADLYVNCSVGTEATSLAIAEAMSVSLPVVATRYGGNTAMVKDGKNGILVPPNDPNALASALLVMTDENRRLRFGKSSYEIYASNFSAETMARSNEALYQNLFIKKGYSLP